MEGGAGEQEATADHSKKLRYSHRQMADENTLVSLWASGALGVLQGHLCEEWEVASRK